MITLAQIRGAGAGSLRLQLLTVRICAPGRRQQPIRILPVSGPGVSSPALLDALYALYALYAPGGCCKSSGRLPDPSPPKLLKAALAAPGRGSWTCCSSPAAH